MRRRVIRIVEEKCDGCGQCVTACAEGAIALRDGKARLVSETYCDGLGACLGECPQGAILVEEREAPDFDPAAVEAHLRTLDRPPAGLGGLSARPAPAPVTPAASPVHGHFGHPAATHGHAVPFTCPGSAMRQFAPAPSPTPAGSEGPCESPTALTHWPVQLMLVPPGARFLQGAHLLVCADCVPFAVPDFHRRFLVGKSVLVGCPKLDDLPHYAEKLREIVAVARPASLTVLRMEVPCCGGIAQALVAARDAAAPHLPVQIHIVGVRGEVRSQVMAGAAAQSPT
ncbi:MAG: 4Fe-4S binding protein [Candidatus Riflebacteria bacterium]|nr:4Fe-4S binding protein [Candidatus Riflebacteria bacterium]